MLRSSPIFNLISTIFQHWCSTLNQRWINVDVPAGVRLSLLTVWVQHDDCIDTYMLISVSKLHRQWLYRPSPNLKVRLNQKPVYWCITPAVLVYHPCCSGVSPQLFWCITPAVLMYHPQLFWCITQLFWCMTPPPAVLVYHTSCSGV